MLTRGQKSLFSAIMLLSGYDRRTEVIHLPTETSCNVDKTFWHGRGGLISDHELLLCDPKGSGLCYNYDPNTMQRQDTEISVLKRQRSASTIIQNKLWITGGGLLDDDGKFIGRTSKTEMVTLENVKSGPDIHVPLQEHCMVTVNTTTVAIIGGNAQNALSETWFYHIENDSFQKVQRAGMNTARKFFACELIDFIDESFIFVAGGWELSSTEIFNIRNNQWKYGPELKVSLRGVSLIWLNQENSLFLLGGKYNGFDDKYSDKIYNLTCQNYLDMQNCEWVELEQKISYPQAYAMVVFRNNA